MAIRMSAATAGNVPRFPFRVGVIYPAPDPFAATNWSGTPAGLREGLIANGIQAIPIPCPLPAWAKYSVAILSRLNGANSVVVHRDPVFIAARTRAIERSIVSALPLDGLIAMGTDMYDLRRAAARHAVPLATYDDGTINLFRQYPGSDISLARYPAEALDVWQARQASAWAAADRVCVSTNWVGRSIVEDFGVASEKISVVGMGHRPRQADIGRDYCAARFLFVGVDWARKNGDRVLLAFAKLRERVPHATLDLIGRHHPVEQDGVTDHGFLDLADKAAQQRLDQLYAEASAFVLPSLFEPYGIAYLEAASAGLPIIATAHGGAREVAAGGSIIVDPYDLDELYRAMLCLADGETARKLGLAAKAAAANSTWSAIAAKIVGTFSLTPARASA